MPWPLDPQGPQARTIADLYWILFAAAIVVLAIVDGALIYAGIKFRERPGHTAAQFHSHNVLELTWTVIPTIMVLTFSILSFQRLNFIDDVTTDAAMTVQVQGQQWTWVFTYPKDVGTLKDGTPLQTAQELHIPAGQKIHLVLTSKDVIHSFMVPKIGGQKDAVPGRTTEIWIQANAPGTYRGQCYEFCGQGHADMLITLVAHPVTEYGTWAKSAITDAERLNDPAVKKGKDTFLALPCVGCHTIAGTTAAGKVAPRELTHMASFKDIAGVLSPVNAENLAKWIKNPPAVKPGTQMPNYGLDDATIDDIVKFLLTLK